TLLICSFTDFRSSPIPPSLNSTYIGYWLVNHPTVPLTSTPLPTSSRPCPSISNNQPLSPPPPPFHLRKLLTSPVTNTSWIRVRYARGTSCNRSLVSSRPN